LWWLAQPKGNSKTALTPKHIALPSLLVDDEYRGFSPSSTNKKTEATYWG
jgi:hypothetical protein